MRSPSLVACLALVGCAAARPAPASSPASSAAATLAVVGSVPLPGLTTPPVAYDYLVVDRTAGRVFVPVANTGSVDVLDVASRTFARVDGFATAEREVRGKKRLLGPSSATVGDGVVYVGNRGTRQVCAVDPKANALGKCLELPVPPDGLLYVPSTKEVWVTTPQQQSLTVLDASDPAVLAPKATVKTDGEPEGFGVDETRGLFFTNLEDKNATLAIDLRTREVRATWSPRCSSDGPRGLVVDAARGFVVVACTDHVQVLDAAHGGAPLGSVATGAGVDNVDYVASTQLLYVAARGAARLSVVHVDDRGTPTIVAAGPTAEGSRNAVADAAGNAYVVDPQGARLLILRKR